jgi:gamma-glutamylcyclotransferase (GGCT)/AIG2-like uncharacterized protein YtfP
LTRILVYGTLRKGQGANRFLGDAEFVEEVRLPGYDMYALGWFPGIVPNPDNKEGVVGEVYELTDDDKIKDLDAYEGYSPDYEEHSLYLRREVEVLGKPTYVYVYNRPVDGIVDMKLPSGDWKENNNV